MSVFLSLGFFFNFGIFIPGSFAKYPGYMRNLWDSVFFRDFFYFRDIPGSGIFFVGWNIPSKTNLLRLSTKLQVKLLERIPTLLLTDTGEDSKLVPRRKRPKVDARILFSFFRRVRATSMTQRRVENTRVHFWTFSPVSVKSFIASKIERMC